MPVCWDTPSSVFGNDVNWDELDIEYVYDKTRFADNEYSLFYEDSKCFRTCYPPCMEIAIMFEALERDSDVMVRVSIGIPS